LGLVASTAALATTLRLVIGAANRVLIARLLSIDNFAVVGLAQQFVSLSLVLGSAGIPVWIYYHTLSRLDKDSADFRLIVYKSIFLLVKSISLCALSLLLVLCAALIYGWLPLKLIVAVLCLFPYLILAPLTEMILACCQSLRHPFSASLLLLSEAAFRLVLLCAASLASSSGLVGLAFVPCLMSASAIVTAIVATRLFFTRLGFSPREFISRFKDHSTLRIDFSDYSSSFKYGAPTIVGALADTFPLALAFFEYNVTVAAVFSCFKEFINVLSSIFQYTARTLLPWARKPSSWRRAAPILLVAATSIILFNVYISDRVFGFLLSSLYPVYSGYIVKNVGFYVASALVASCAFGLFKLFCLRIGKVTVVLIAQILGAITIPVALSASLQIESASQHMFFTGQLGVIVSRSLLFSFVAALIVGIVGLKGHLKYLK